MPEEEEEEDSDSDSELQPVRRRGRAAAHGGGRGRGHGAGDTFKWEPKDYNYPGYFDSSPGRSPDTSTGARAAVFESPHIPPRRALSKAARAGAEAAAVAAARNTARHSRRDTPRPVRQPGQFRSLGDPVPVASTPHAMAGSLRTSVTISTSMPSDEIFANLRQVASPSTMSGLAGHLLPHVAPSFIKSLVGCRCTVLLIDT